MSVKQANFIVVSLADLDNYGFDEHTLPALASLVDSHEPDCRLVIYAGIQAFFLASEATRNRVARLVADAKRLKTEKRFESLGVGTAEGLLLADFNWLGKLKSDTFMPMGDASAQALKNAKNKDGRTIASSESPTAPNF